MLRVGFLAAFAVKLLEAFMDRHDSTREIIGVAIKIHRKLGSGLLESAYEACLSYELEKLGLRSSTSEAGAFDL